MRIEARRAMRTLALIACIALHPSAHATEIDPALPPYDPMPVQAPAADRPWLIFGYNDMRSLLEPLVARFEATHPGRAIMLDLPGTRFAPASLAEGRADLAPMGAVLTPAQRAAYRAAAAADPIEIKVAHASIDPLALSGPLGVFVHADNPVPALTLAQLASAFEGRVTRWGDLGAAGAWAALPIHLYGVKMDSPLGLAMQDAVRGGPAFGAGMAGSPQSAEVVAKVGQDRLGLGYAAAMRTQPSVRMVPVARDADAEKLLPTEATLLDGRYPLDRYLLVYARRPLEPFAREFLRLMLSREGQQVVAATPQRYLPLSAAEAAVERAKLGEP